MPKTKEKISALGFGCMRLPQDNVELCRRLISSAVESGINYFDTAYIYPGNEVLMGELLSGGLRDKIKLATKLPPIACRSFKDFDKLLDTQFKRLKTDHIDYYLIHALADFDVWARLCRLGIKDWIADKKASGKIVNIGFSYHGGSADFKRLIDDFEWDFAQIQYNYLDENNQAGVSGLDYAMERGIPIVIMEPLRGGKLTANLPEEAKKLLRDSGREAADIGLRWVWNHPGVMTVLSGMNSMPQLDENIATAETALAGSMSDDDFKLVDKIKAVFGQYSVIPCTGCAYCMPCPFGVAIPDCFSARNSFEFAKRSGEKKPFRFNPARQQYIHSTGLIGKSAGNAAKCKKCGQCEKKCPQGIKIRDCLDEVSKTMEPWWFSIPLSIARAVNSRK